MKLTKEGFLRWLLSKPADNVVGWRGIPCHCPLATFLRENGLTRARVSQRRWYADDHDPAYNPLEEWARRTIDAVDVTHGKVTAAEMLVIMGRLEHRAI